MGTFRFAVAANKVAQEMKLRLWGVLLWEVWVGQVQVQPGRYNYVIVVDGERMLVDPTAPQVVDDGFGGKNSVLDVGSI